MRLQLLVSLSIIDIMESERVKVRRKLCPHCGEFVTKSTYYCHKSRFFDKHTKTWQIEHVTSSRRSSCSDSTDSDSTTTSDESEFVLDSNCNSRRDPSPNLGTDTSVFEDIDGVSGPDITQEEEHDCSADNEGFVSGR